MNYLAAATWSLIDLIMPVMAFISTWWFISSDEPLLSKLIEISPCTTDQKV